MINYVKKTFQKIFTAEKSPTRLTLSFCLGNYIAFSPFLGLHTAMIFLLSYILKLNSVVTFAAAYLINNPITMVPILVVDYIFGVWLFEEIFSINMLKYNPSWMEWFNSHIGHYITNFLGVSEFSFWSFILGGNILAIFLSVSLYPFLRPIFAKLLSQLPARFFENKHEDNSTK